MSGEPRKQFYFFVVGIPPIMLARFIEWLTHDAAGFFGWHRSGWSLRLAIEAYQKIVASCGRGCSGCHRQCAGYD
jgi:hypothetical protein